MADLNTLTRPIIGIENRTAQEVFDIMCDRIRAEVAPAPSSQLRVTGEALKTLSDRISAAEADREDDIEAGERADLFDYDIELPLATAKAIASALAAQPAPAEQVLGWRTVDTCPKNKSVILQCFWNHQPTSPYVFEGFLDWDGVTWHEQNGEPLRADISAPAYWQPMPLPASTPVAATSEGGE